MTRLLAVILTSTLLSVTACSSATSDWRKASTDNTVAGYQQFLSAHPKDEHADEARAMIVQLQDSDAWAQAQHTSTLAGYKGYLDKFPAGSHDADAHKAMTGLQRADAWNTVKSQGAPELKAFLEKYPTGSESDQARAALQKLMGYHVRLATEPSHDRAEKKLTQLKAQLKDQVPDLDVATSSDEKPSFSVESGGMTDEDAKSLCKTLEKHHQTCKVVSS
jgi:hypothetical protein